MSASVRALRVGRAARAARHRRRFRARAARRGHPAHLRELQAQTRRAHRNGDLLSRPQRHPRRRQGVRPVQGRHRCSDLHDLGLVDGGRDEGRGAPRGLDPSDPRLKQTLALAERAAWIPAASLPARRRLRHLGIAPRRGRADRERRDGRPHGDRVGQGRSRCPGNAQGRCAGARHAVVPAPRSSILLRNHYGNKPHALRAFRKTTRPSTA